jgi:phage shock protein A
MSLIDRARTAIWSNVNAITQKIESSAGNVSSLIEQMGLEIKKAKQELLRVLAEEKRLRKVVAERKEQVEQWLSRAELAVRSGNDEMARDALIQRKRIADEVARDAAAAEEHAALAREMNGDIRLMESRFHDIAARKSTLTTSIERGKAGGGVESLGATAGVRPFDELARVEQAIEDAELKNDAVTEVERIVEKSAAEDTQTSSSQQPRRKFRIE